MWASGAVAITPAGWWKEPNPPDNHAQENSFEPFKQTINIQEQVQTQSQTTTRRRPKNSTNGGLPSERFK
ncbi:hypothetical protein ACLKA7_009719 [Drosophila subpalustris]